MYCSTAGLESHTCMNLEKPCRRRLGSDPAEVIPWATDLNYQASTPYYFHCLARQPSQQLPSTRRARYRNCQAKLVAYSIWSISTEYARLLSCHQVWIMLHCPIGAASALEPDAGMKTFETAPTRLDPLPTSPTWKRKYKKRTEGIGFAVGFHLFVQRYA